MRTGRRTLALALGALLLLAAACGDDDPPVDDGAPEPTAETAQDSTLGEGEDVTVRGTVDDVVAGVAFTLTDATVEEGTADAEGEVAVIMIEGDSAVAESEEVIVSGTLLSLDISDNVQELETLFGADVDDEILAFLDGQRVIVASSVDEGV